MRKETANALNTRQIVKQIYDAIRLAELALSSKTHEEDKLNRRHRLRRNFEASAYMLSKIAY